MDSAAQTFTLTVSAFVAGGTFKGKVYETVTSPDTSRVWLDRNLGADQVCTAYDDPDCFGYYYQWGRDDDGHELTSSTVTATLATVITPAINSFITNNTAPNDWTSADSSGSLREAAWANAGANDICPVGFGVPTQDELDADTTSATAVTVWDDLTAFTSFLKLPVAGHREAPTATVLIGEGYLGTRTTLLGEARVFYYGPSSGFENKEKGTGVSVRCIKDL